MLGGGGGGEMCEKVDLMGDHVASGAMQPSLC